jgi:hypothetical protein
MTKKDQDLVDYLVDSTEKGILRWESTAEPMRFTVGLRGQYSADIIFNTSGPDYIELRNADGDVILKVNENDYERVILLFSLARRSAYNVDNAIDEILGLKSPEKKASEEPKGSSAPITDEDIPF